MPTLGLAEIISILIVWGIPLAIIVWLGGFAIRTVRVSNTRHARVVGHLERIEAELRGLREDLRRSRPSASDEPPASP